MLEQTIFAAQTKVIISTMNYHSEIWMQKCFQNILQEPTKSKLKRSENESQREFAHNFLLQKINHSQTYIVLKNFFASEKKLEFFKIWLFKDQSIFKIWIFFTQDIIWKMSQKIIIMCLSSNQSDYNPSTRVMWSRRKICFRKQRHEKKFQHPKEIKHKFFPLWKGHCKNHQYRHYES